MKNIIIFLVMLALLIPGVAACSKVSDGPLPHSLKGYELYSWLEAGRWHFTLITGTNRNKDLEEIIDGEDEVTEDGWVNLHAVGVEEIKDVLSRVPDGEFVFWGDSTTIEPSTSGMGLSIPPAEIINDIREYAERGGVELMGP